MAETEKPPAKAAPKAVTEDALAPVVEKLASMVTVKEVHEISITVPIGFHKALRDIKIEREGGEAKPAGEGDMKAAMSRLLEAAAKKEKRVCHKVKIVSDNDKGHIKAVATLVTTAEKKELDAAAKAAAEAAAAKKLAEIDLLSV
jgi:hypothetical protein